MLLLDTQWGVWSRGKEKEAEVNRRIGEQKSMMKHGTTELQLTCRFLMGNSKHAA